MIVIATNQFDASSSDVMEWLDGESVLRINSDNFQAHAQANQVSFDFSYPLSSINSIWFRKGSKVKVDIETENEEILRHCTDELIALNGIYFSPSSMTKTLGTTEALRFSKLCILQSFKRHLLKIPPTLVTNRKSNLIDFKNKHGELIIKPISDGAKFEIEGQIYKIYTEILTDRVFDQLGEQFFPTLFQKRIRKKYEIRSFVLDGEIFSMALIGSKSDLDPIDIRYTTRSEVVRSVPYQLPPEIEVRMVEVMKSLQLDTASFDIIKAIDNNYYFLEINPSGQFGNLSYMCNYYLEEKIANYLKDGDNI